MKHAEMLWGGKNNPPLPLDILRKRETIYRMSDIGPGSLLKVGGIPLMPRSKSKPEVLLKPIYTKARLGLFETNLS
jgi:hypothetical protein